LVADEVGAGSPQAVEDIVDALYRERDVTCGRPSGRADVAQYTAAASRRLRPSLHAAAVALAAEGGTRFAGLAAGGEEMAIKNVAVVSVPVSDQERAKTFYVDKLGFELQADQSMPPLRWIRVGPKGGATALTLVDWFDSMPAGSLRGLVVTTDDLQGDYERLKAKGVEFDGPPKKQPWATETVLHDPDGNRIVLQQAA